MARHPETTNILSKSVVHIIAPSTLFHAEPDLWQKRAQILHCRNRKFVGVPRPLAGPSSQLGCRRNSQRTADFAGRMGKSDRRVGNSCACDSADRVNRHVSTV